MSRIAYVNGAYVPHRQAAVHIEDRGYQFADGVYEVTAIYRGRLIDESPHLDRLERSLSELSIAMPMSRRALALVMRRMIRYNHIHEGTLYLQVTRGVAPRNHQFPTPAVTPSMVMTARSVRLYNAEVLARGVSVITRPDIRWQRCDIKSVGLLPNALSKQKAVEAGAYEAWLVNDQAEITEATAANAWIVNADGVLVTRHLSNHILAGVTRKSLSEVATRHGISIEQRPFSVAEALTAREAFVTGTGSMVRAVTRIDETVIGDGVAGPLTRDLITWYGEYLESCVATPDLLPA